MGIVSLKPMIVSYKSRIMPYIFKDEYGIIFIRSVLEGNTIYRAFSNENKRKKTTYWYIFSGYFKTHTHCQISVKY